MFNISEELKTRAQEVATLMEKESLDVHDLHLHTFKGVLVRDQSSELKKRIDAKAYIIGEFIAKSNKKYWISLN